MKDRWDFDYYNLLSACSVSDTHYTLNTQHLLPCSRRLAETGSISEKVRGTEPAGRGVLKGSLLVGLNTSLRGEQILQTL